MKELFRRHPLGFVALFVVVFIAWVGVYAPLFASSKPLFLIWDGTPYFPLFRYLFFNGFFTKPLDLFFNLIMVLFPFWMASFLMAPSWLRRGVQLSLWGIFSLAFLWVLWVPGRDPASDPQLNEKRQKRVQSELVKRKGDPLLVPLPIQRSWSEELAFMTPYGKLNAILEFRQQHQQHQNLEKYRFAFAQDEKARWVSRAMREEKSRAVAKGEGIQLDKRELEKRVLAQVTVEEERSWEALPTLWQIDVTQREKERQEQLEVVEELGQGSEEAKDSLAHLQNQYRPLSPSYLEALQVLKEAKKQEKEAYLQFLAGTFSAEHLEEKREDLKRAQEEFDRVSEESQNLRIQLAQVRAEVQRYEEAQARLHFLADRERWLQEESAKIEWELPAWLRPFHWEDDAGGEQSLNQYVDWWHLTRTNRKDLVAGLLFGIRISLIVGGASVALAMLIGIPLGAFSGYYGGKFDILVFRAIEVWESMPVFFMLLMVVSITQSKSIFLVITVLGVFGWTGFSRYVRGEFLKQRHLPYVDACRAMGYRDRKIIFDHILPNAIPPLLTLLPFSILGAITSEAGLSFLGLGEEGSCSLGVLMDEGRAAFPAESYLLWPPALVLTCLLVAVALVGDALRDGLDPKMRH